MIHKTRPEDWQKAADWLIAADALMITAGAGMGVDSGLPDFRGDEGFWQAYPPLKQLGLSFVEMANPQGFARNPPLAWGFYGHRLNLYRRTLPHAGYHLLREWGMAKPLGYFVFTSNVDGHFQKAGFDHEHVEECHGSIHRMQCTAPCNEEVWSAEGIQVEVDEKQFLAAAPLPQCIHCHRLARPNILMFGDDSWIAAPTGEQSQRRHAWLTALQTRKGKLVIVELGAGQAVATVRFFSERLARLPGASLIRINPRDCGINANNHVALQTGALEGLTRIASLLPRHGE
ncbi:MAG: NAD-dependent deacetylase [Magnetococcales bacterium]|nr:NAD-dependent deacetylase [Magnetococcales bacterium]